MKYLIILLFFLLVGCDNNVLTQDTNYRVNGEEVQIITIDSCEYIVIGFGRGKWGSHKGNCKYCEYRSDLKNTK